MLDIILRKKKKPIFSSDIDLNRTLSTVTVFVHPLISLLWPTSDRKQYAVGWRETKCSGSNNHYTTSSDIKLHDDRRVPGFVQRMQFHLKNLRHPQSLRDFPSTMYVSNLNNMKTNTLFIKKKRNNDSLMIFYVSKTKKLKNKYYTTVFSNTYTEKYVHVTNLLRLLLI